MKGKAELILHPIRMRILIALAAKPLTASEIDAKLKDVPQATLYRHINRLAEANIVHVVEEHQVRGVVEKVYALNSGGAQLSPEDMQGLTADDHLQIFTAFIATLMDDMQRYLQQDGGVNWVADEVGFRKVPFFASDEEFSRLVQTINEAFLPLLFNGPSPTRKRRLIATVTVPIVDDNADGTIPANPTTDDSQAGE